MPNVNQQNLQNANRPFQSILFQGVLVLITDYLKLIRDAPAHRKSEQFSDLAKELRSHLDKKSKLPITESEMKKRHKRIAKIKKELFELERKIKRYRKTEVSLDDLDSDSDKLTPLEKLQKCEKRAVKLYTEMRQLQHKHLYFGHEEINFDDVSENEELNELLRKEILRSFEKKREKPDYCQVNEIVERFSRDRGVLLDSQQIFKRICSKLKRFTFEVLETNWNAYLDEQSNGQANLPDEEDEELKRKLDENNKFKDQLEAVVARFVERAEREPDDQPDEETEDSESDSVCEDENELESISENEEEFIAKEDGSSDEGSNGDEGSDGEGSDGEGFDGEGSDLENEETESKTNSETSGESTLKRSISDQGECLKKVKIDDDDDDGCIVLN